MKSTHVGRPVRASDSDSASKPTFDALGAARRLIPDVLAARDECERLRHIPPSLAEALAKSRLLQMMLPRSMGGDEVAPLDGLGRPVID